MMGKKMKNKRICFKSPKSNEKYLYLISDGQKSIVKIMSKFGAEIMMFPILKL